MTAIERCPIRGVAGGITRLGLGCEQLGGTDWGVVHEDELRATVHSALDAGVDFFDTADVYGLGASEERLRKWLGASRHNVTIATKGGVNWASNGDRAHTFTDCSPAHIREAVHSSLRRLGVDRIPLYQLHRHDSIVPLGDTLETLSRLREEGKIAAVGYSNFPAEALRRAHALLPAASVQVAFNLISWPETAVIEFCRLNGIALLAYGPLAQGLLSGKYNREVAFSLNDRRHRLAHFAPEQIEERAELLRTLQAFADRYRVSAASLAVRWVLDAPGVSAVIVGGKRPTQVQDVLAASGWSISLADWKVLSRLGLSGTR